jgi:signal transduction histidine kinase
MKDISVDVTVPWRVVLIDDNEDDRAEVRRLLLRGSDRRYTFAEAETGSAGVALVLSSGQLPDCVLLDYNLPDMDALEVLAALARPDGLLVCPVVVLTGGAGPEARRAVLRAGAQDYIGKDWLSPPGLTWVVENAIERLAMARQLLLREEALHRNEKVLAEADQRKDEFIAMLAHELRNPLSPVRTGTQVLRLTQDVEIQRRTLDMMDRQLGQMTRLIDDLLDVSRITNSKVLLRLERVSVYLVAEAAAEAARSVMDAGHHELLVKLPPEDLWLDADPTRLAQVIGNLLNNSAKYSPNGGCITLAFWQETDQVVIRITDTGLGIPPDMLDEVFEMFTQVNRTLDRAQGGLGIGLALVKRLVEMHHGTVTAESEGAGHGSAFTVRLPRAAAPEIDVDVLPLPSEFDTANGKRILVVDDNVDGASALALMLSFSGHETQIAFNGPDALKTALQFNPEVVFLDIGLPGMNGYEVAKRFRADPNLKSALLVAMTGWGTEEDRLQSKKAGFDEHLTKPVEGAAFNEVLARLAGTPTPTSLSPTGFIA